MCRMWQLCYHWFLVLAIAAVSADRHESLAAMSPSSTYIRRSNDRDRSLIREREGIHRIVKIYHYDNLTDCELACEIPCGMTYVIRNDVDERRQYICTQRKVPVVSAFIDISNTGILTFILASALILCGLLLIACCCCIRSSCCMKACRSSNSSNDPLVNGEFRETLDSKDIGYLKKEASRKIVSV